MCLFVVEDERCSFTLIHSTAPLIIIKLSCFNSNVQCLALYLFYNTHFGHLMKETVPDLAKSQ